MKVLIIKLLAVVGLLAFALPSDAYASEGFSEMRSTTGEETRCRVDSHLMQNNNFSILVSCRELIYPATNVVTTYIVWAAPVGGGKTIKLGTLEYGRKSYTTKTAFSNLFVTSETKAGATPAGPVILRGEMQPYTFLQRPTTPTPTEEPDKVEGSTESGKEAVSPENMTTRQKLVAAFKKAGLAAALALVALIGLIFVVTRSRG